MQDYKKLEIWKKAKTLSVEIYKLTENFPPTEQFGITNQMQRAAVSVSSNIAEGSGRNTSKDFASFIDRALGSLFELESQLIIASELEYLSKKELEELLESIDELKRKIINFLKCIRS